MAPQRAARDRIESSRFLRSTQTLPEGCDGLFDGNPVETSKKRRRSASRPWKDRIHSQAAGLDTRPGPQEKTMDFRVLGSIRFEIDGEEITVRPQAQLLVAFMLVSERQQIDIQGFANLVGEP